MQYFVFWFGVVLVVVGCLVFIFGNEAAAENEVSVLGFGFRLSHPSLVIIALGFVLVLLNYRDLHDPSSSTVSLGNGGADRAAPEAPVPRPGDPHPAPLPAAEPAKTRSAGSDESHPQMPSIDPDDTAPLSTSEGNSDSAKESKAEPMIMIIDDEPKKEASASAQ